jgi:HSP20 family protein
MPELNVQKVRAADDRTLPIFAEFDKLADRIRLEAYNLFARRGAGDGHALDDWLAAEHEVCWPSAELTEQDGKYALKVALAGFEPGEITVTATPREIIVKAAHKEEKKPAGEGKAKVRWSEFRSNDVFRRVDLPAPVDVERISANFKNGLLEIVAPRAQPAAESASKIEVSAGS